MIREVKYSFWVVQLMSTVQQVWSSIAPHFLALLLLNTFCFFPLNTYYLWQDILVSVNLTTLPAHSLSPLMHGGFVPSSFVGPPLLGGFVPSSFGCTYFILLQGWCAYEFVVTPQPASPWALSIHKTDYFEWFKNSTCNILGIAFCYIGRYGGHCWK